jgi:hypothetical protein
MAARMIRSANVFRDAEFARAAARHFFSLWWMAFHHAVLSI